MTSITIPTIWNKTEEKQFLDRLQKAFESSDTYLQEFFTKDLVESLKTRISNDFPCDYHADLEAWKDRCDELNKELPEMEERLLRAEVTKENLMANIESKQAEIDSLEAKLEQAKSSASEVFADKEDLEVELGVKDFQIIELKAMLWDLEHPSKKATK